MAAKKANAAQQKNAGVRGGSETTDRYESLQAYTCAARALNGKPLTSIEEVKKILKEQEKNRLPRLVKATSTLQSIIGNISETYFHSCISIANQMFIDYPFITADTHGFYRGASNRVQALYDEFNKFKKDTGLSNPNKWNPADIWVVHTRFRPKTGFERIEDLNEFIRQQYDAGMLIGVSLKKVEAKNKAVGIVYNYGQSHAAKFAGFRPGGLLESKDAYIDFKVGNNTGTIQLRIFSSQPKPGGWQAEIAGKTAAAGKIGGNIMVSIANEMGANVPNGATLASSKLTNPQDSTIKEFINTWKDLKEQKSMSSAEQKNLFEETKKRIKTDKTWWVSKYISLNYCYQIKKVSKPKLDNIVNKVYKYGSSATQYSSVFVKYGPD